MTMLISQFVHIPAYYPVPDGKGHWISQGPMVFYSARLSRTLIVPTGSVNDLASIPWALRRCFPINGPSRPAAALHDYLYSINGNVPRNSLTRRECDQVFHEAMQVPKRMILAAYPIDVIAALKKNNLYHLFLEMTPMVDGTQAKAMFAGVRIGGWKAWNDWKKHNAA